MRNVKIYEDFQESWSRSGLKTSWTDNCPKAMSRELTRHVKDALNSLPEYIWAPLGKTIERIDCLISRGFSGGLQWKDIMKDSSRIAGMRNQTWSIGQPLEEEAINYFNGCLARVLDAGVCKPEGGRTFFQR